MLTHDLGLINNLLLGTEIDVDLACPLGTFKGISGIYLVLDNFNFGKQLDPLRMYIFNIIM